LNAGQVSADRKDFRSFSASSILANSSLLPRSSCRWSTALRDDRNPGVALSHLRLHDAGVRLYCRGCALTRDLDLERVIVRLEARSVGGDATGIREGARFVREPCPRCGGQVFETVPAFKGMAMTPDRMPPARQT
jgi:hypothetical protein